MPVVPEVPEVQPSTTTDTAVTDTTYSTTKTDLDRMMVIGVMCQDAGEKTLRFLEMDVTELQ